MILPDIRNKVVEPLYANTKGGKEEDKENAYYQGYLNDRDAEFITGYDWFVEQLLSSFIYSMADRLNDEDLLTNKQYRELTEIIPLFVESFKNDQDFDFDENINDNTVRVILESITSIMIDAELERDELGVSFIDNMDDEEYDECKKKYEDGYKNAVLLTEERLQNE